ncbi:NO-inducible flavohemoprotein [Paeniroseomonas aquatica]|uniref:Flavohemoprotein n=1 Tax=Paeniroseomonas aquatica TaxID=373043 RepID=A0ABT8AFT7_9PROT|nr:NO-inducible flavohemoprotein [Paeniroseomonas aquatica]MDN3568540.1 NO-inducible flavohemoprotein [Paeniroseomonas aquatica]
MLSDTQRKIIKATVPALRAHGETITRTFYSAMLQAHPELLNYFNPANQRGEGGQARSLAASVLAYAANIDQLSNLDGMVERIATKHVSLEIRPEHYPIVGQYLLGAITEVLGDAATPEIIDAWAAAYGQLADIMIGREQALYSETATQPGGWAGFKPFRVLRKVRESDVTTSFHLVPVDGAPLPDFRPGQYLSVKTSLPGYPYEQVRQYSLSQAPDGRHYRISVKREDAPAGLSGVPAGLVSNFLHDTVTEGSTLLVHMPVGDFVLDEHGDRPVVLISGGAGITAVLAMLEELAMRTTRNVLMLHAVRSRGHHAFAERVRALAASRTGIRSMTLYETVNSDDVPDEHYDAVGRITAEVIRPYLPAGDADFYYCGPIGFMTAAERALDELGVPPTRRHSEAFAPDPSFTAGMSHSNPHVEAA